MNLLELRTKFREISGRYDLVNDDGSDNGADFFINTGQKFLDRIVETQKSTASCFRFIEQAGFSTSIPYCRAIREVWAMSTNSRWRLRKSSLRDLITSYLNVTPSNRNQGTPLYYSPGITRYIPENSSSASFESFVGWVDVPAGKAHEYNTIILNVPSSEKIALEIKGLFYTAQLTNDKDENYWSVSNPFLLILSALRQLEIINRNTQGVNDWTNAILAEANQLGMDLIEEQIAEVDSMESEI